MEEKLLIKAMVTGILDLKFADMCNFIRCMKENLGDNHKQAAWISSFLAIWKNTEGLDSWRVVLTDVGTQKINVIKKIRELTGLGLKEAKELTEDLPKIIKDNFTLEEAREMQKSLAMEGGYSIMERNELDYTSIRTFEEELKEL